VTKDLKIKISIDKKTGELKVVNGELNKVSNSVKKAGDATGKFSKRLVDMAHTAVGLYAVTKAFDMMYESAKQFINTASMFEKYNTTLKTIEGSSQKASQSMDWITNFAAKTPYQLDQVTASFIKLKSYGITPTDGTLKTLGDTASGLGKSLNDAVEAMADAVVGENERLKEFGIRASKQGNQIAYSWMTASGKSKHIIIQNNSEIIQSTLTAIFNSKYAGAMEAQSRTLAGMLSNMQDNWTKFQNKAMQNGLYQYLKSIVYVVGERLSEAFKVTADNTQSFATKAINWIDNVIGALGFMKDAVTGIQVVVKGLEIGFYYLVKGITYVVDAGIDSINYLIEKYNSLPEWLRGEKIGIFNNLGQGAIDNEITKSKQEIDKLVASLEDGRKSAKDFLKDVDVAFKTLGKDTKDVAKEEVKGAMDGAYTSTTNNVKKMQEKAARAALGDKTTLDRVFDNINKAMEYQFFDAMTGKFKSFGSWLQDFWSSITESMARGLSKTLADSMMGGIRGGIQNQFRGFGLFGSAGAVGTSLSASGVQSVGGKVGEAFVTKGGTVIDASGKILKAGTDSNSILSNTSNLSQASAWAGALYAPSYYMGQAAGMAYGAGFTGTGSFLAGSANVLGGGGISGLSGAAWAGGALTAGALGGLGGYALGSIGDKLFGADTKAANYGAIGGSIGAVVGSVVPGLGTLIGGAIGAALGSVVGGFFGSTSMTGSEQGIDIFGSASSESVKGREWLVKHMKKSSWFSSSSWDEWSYSGFSDKQIGAIKSVIGTFDQLLWMMGDTEKTLTIQGGRYSSIESFLNNGVVKAFLTETTTANLSDVYSVWSDYAKSVNKKIYEAFSDVVNNYVSSRRGFQEWYLGFKGNSIGLAKYQQQTALEDLSIVQRTIGESAAGVTIENYMSAYKKAIETNFTPQVVDQWKALGEALMKASDAQKKYQDALTGGTSVVNGRADMMLAGAYNATAIDLLSAQNNADETNKLLFYAILKELKKQTSISQGLVA